MLATIFTDFTFKHLLPHNDADCAGIGVEIKIKKTHKAEVRVHFTRSMKKF